MSDNSLTEQDWISLESLRDLYLSPELKSHQTDYWTTRLLQLYDFTFGQRIRWKIDAVFQELQKLGYSPPSGASLLDWACGTGSAARMFLKFFPTVQSVEFSDRSSKAIEFAASKLKEDYPIVHRAEKASDILLVSHALTELSSGDLSALLIRAQSFRTVILIEPGTTDASQMLISIREKLKAFFYIVAPCFHQSTCGLLNKGDTPNWCHFKAPVPADVFQSRFWKQYSERMHIDLRSLPVSYLVLSKDFKPLRPGTRVLAGSRFYKGYAQVVSCTEKGVEEVKLLERSKKKEIKELRKESFLSTIDDK